MNRHMETNKINHELLLLKTVKNLKQKSDESEEKLKVKDAEIEQLKELNAKKDEKLNKLNKKVERNEKEIINLKTFAERISQLHLTLSDDFLQTNSHYDWTLFQEDYDTNEEVKEWHKMVEEVDEDENECEYLETLKESINQYKETIYSTTYKERIENFCRLTPPGVSRGNFAKIKCLLTTKFIRFEKFYKLERFQNHSAGNVLFQNYGSLFTYYVGDCLHIAFYKSYIVYVYLLHCSDEDKTLNLPNKETIKIDNYMENLYDNSIVLYIDK